MNQEILNIVDAIKIIIPIATVNGKDVKAEVSPCEVSKKYLYDLIEEYGNLQYNKGLFNASM